MDKAALLAFLLVASRRGYAAGRSAVKVREADGSTTIVYDHGDWRFHDNYFGGEPYGGREVVFLGGWPVWVAVYFWVAVYYRWVEGVDVDAERVYLFLQRALRRRRRSSRYVVPMSSRRGRPRTGARTKAAWPTSRAKRPFTRAGGASTRPGTSAGWSTDEPATRIRA